MDPLDRARVFELPKGRPEHAHPDGQQHGAKCQRSGGLEALMAVLMVLVGGLLAVAAGEENNKVSDQVRDGMHAVSDQPLRC